MVPKKHNKLTIVCETCGKNFKDWKGNKRRFCSPDCYYTSLKGKRRAPKTEFSKGHIPWWILRNELNPAKRPEIRQKKSQITEGLWRDENFVRKQMRSRGARPNKSERYLELLMKQNNLPFHYVGDGTLIIHGKCPDYISEDHSQIIELFGDYWHDLEEAEKRINFFAVHGFETMIIWGSSLRRNPEQVLQRITSFSGVGKL